jgi:hypothetical protein
MAQSQIFTGARAKLLINGKAVGLFANCNWSVRQEKVPAFILGAYAPVEITQTTQEAITMDLRGYRVVDSGPYAVANVTMLKNLLTEEDFSVAITDRQTGKMILLVQGCKATGFSSGAASKSVSDISVSILGLRADDEYTLSQGGDGEPGASTLTDGS